MAIAVVDNNNDDIFFNKGVDDKLGLARYFDVGVHICHWR